MAHAPTMVVVMPTYNEIESLPETVARLRSAVPDADVLVVDDNSPDGTGQLADRLASEDPRVSVLHRQEKAGLGVAYLHGFRVAIERGYDIIGEIDADGSHPPDRLPAMIEALQHADLVIGSRWVPGGSVVDWPWRRRALSRAGNFYARSMLGVGVSDLTAGFRLFRRQTLLGIDLDGVESAGYCFQIDMAYRVHRAGGRVVEVPIRFVERARGESKMDGEVALESLLKVTKWGVGRLRGPRSHDG